MLIPQPTNRTEPTGGVMFPRHILKISITPNWISVIPRLCAIGRKIGVKIRIAGVMSMNIPTTMRMMFISRKITYLFVEMDMRPVEMAAGIPEYAMTKDMAEDAEIKNRMIPLGAGTVYQDFCKGFYSDAPVTDRENQAIKNADACTFGCSENTAHNTADDDHDQKQTWDRFQSDF